MIRFHMPHWTSVLIILTLISYGIKSVYLNEHLIYAGFSLRYATCLLAYHFEIGMSVNKKSIVGIFIQRLRKKKNKSVQLNPSLK